MKRITLGLALIFGGCVIDGGTDAPSPDPDPEPDLADVEPRAGLWSYDDAITSNTCPPNTPNGEFGAFAIDQVSSARFRVLPNDGTGPFLCDLSKGDFDCPDRGEIVEDLRPGVDAVLTAEAIAEGTFSSSTAGTGSQTATVTCVGAACAALGNFPCSIRASFAIAAD